MTLRLLELPERLCRQTHQLLVGLAGHQHLISVKSAETIEPHTGPEDKDGVVACGHGGVRPWRISAVQGPRYKARR